jgi:3-hydroxyacyl-CoA dehydrogenase
MQKIKADSDADLASCDLIIEAVFKKKLKMITVEK